MSEYEINFFGFHEENTIADVRKVFEKPNPLAEGICRRMPQLLENPDFLNDFKGNVKFDVLTCFYEILFKSILTKDEYEIYLGYRNFKLPYTDFTINIAQNAKWIQENAIDYLLSPEGWNAFINDISCITEDMNFCVFRSAFTSCLNSSANNSKRAWLIKEDKINKIFTESVLEESDIIQSSPFPVFDSLGIGKNLCSKKSLILTGAPGTGKTHHVQKYVNFMTGSDKNRQKLVQFHPSYDYTDFVEGLRPAVVGKNNGIPVTQFVRMDGQFKALCRRAAEDSSARRYYFIIDEINRAELSRVFGELMYCMEYRGERIETQYQNLPTYVMGEDGIAVPIENDVFADGFYIPENVYIIGTMNDIDRSVDSFDFALRRRFEWHEVEAKDTMEDALRELYDEGFLKEITDRAKALNHYIATEGKSFGLNSSYHLGQAYFRDYAGYEDAGNYFDDKLKSILFEYVRGRKNEKDFLEGARKAFCAELTEDRNAPEA